MPAIDINPWMRELLGQLSQLRQRQLLALQGPRDWCDAQVDALASLDLPMHVFSNRERGIEAIPFASAETRLGDEASLVIVDLFGGFNPDVLCIAAGLVRCGGVLLLISAPTAEWNLQADDYASWQNATRSQQARFPEYFFAELLADERVGKVISPGPLPSLELDLPALQPTVIERGATPQQHQCLRQIEQWLESRRNGVVLIEAQRGRGKSSCLGLLVKRLPADCRALVCASSRQAAAALLRFAADAEFVAPDQLLREAPPAELVVIDEAAMIPQSLLRQIGQRYPRLVMASTSGGYEGTGQGFRLRFIADLPSDRLLRLELVDPVRWCRDDYLEGWLNRVMLQDTETVPALAGVDLDACELQCVADPGAADFLPSLREVYRLLNVAHYRTRPSDLRMLMENPDLSLIVARSGERLVGALLLNHEGGFDSRLCRQVFLGKRRPRGHLLAQMLTAQAGIDDFAAYRGLRVQRIAVDAAWRRRGLGTRLLRRARELAVASGLDYLGASFALDAHSAGFWQQAGYSLVHVSYAAGKSSGNHSVAVLHPLQARVGAVVEQLEQRIDRQLPVWMTQFLQLMEAGEAVALLRYSGFDAGLSDLEAQEIDAFARGHRGFELCFASLQRYVMQRIAETSAEVAPLLVEKAVQNRPWERLPRACANEGRKQLQQDLRVLVEALRNDC